MSVTAPVRPVSVAELQRAYRGLLAGQFRPGRATRVESWQPAGVVLPVLGACAGCGSSTTALAIATAAGRATLVECGDPARSRLTSAATAEHGRDGSWVRGARGEVTLLRPAGPVPAVDDVPTPPVGQQGELLVLDVGWDAGAVREGRSWMTPLLDAPRPLVVVAPASVPGARRLDAVLRSVARSRAFVVLLGDKRRPREVAVLVRQVLRAHGVGPERVVTLPWDARLLARGVDSRPLPARLVRSGGEVLRSLRLEVTQP